MAQQGNQVDPAKFTCSICLDLLKNPVTIPCGHNYCLICISSFWDEDQKGIHSCPQCRKEFIPRPGLMKNTMLAELVEELKKTGLEAAPADHCYAGPEDVSCDVCTERKLKAVKSCLVCLASYCEKHLQAHYESPTFKKHKLVEASAELQQHVCPLHDEVMKIFCRTDQQIICYLCLMDEHKGHETVSVTAERSEKQKKLEVSRQEIQQRIQDREKDVKLLLQELEAINVSADKTVEDSEKIFTQLIRLIQERSAVKQQVRSQQETEVSRVKELQEKLEQEITELKRKDQQLEQLSNTEDHNQFLHNYPSESELRESPDSSSIKTRPLRYFQDVTAAVSELREKLQDILRDTGTNISMTVAEEDVLLPQPEPKTRGEVSLSEPEPKTRGEVSLSEPEPKTRGEVSLSEPEPKTRGEVSMSEPEPKTRADFLRYYREITLDPNTVNRRLILSEENRKVTNINKQQPYCNHPDRFTRRWQVLSRESLTGRCYWEVEWSGKAVEVAVAYKSIERTGDSDECFFGSNNKSWSLSCDASKYNFYSHDYNIETSVSGPQSTIVGVYLDHRAGVLSFYSVSEIMILLHRVQTTFTEPLYAGLWLSGSYETSAEFI